MNRIIVLSLSVIASCLTLWGQEKQGKRTNHNWHEEVVSIKEANKTRRVAYYKSLLRKGFEKFPDSASFSWTFKHELGPISLQITKVPAIGEYEPGNDSGKNWRKSTHQLTYYICALLSNNGWNVDNSLAFDDEELEIGNQPSEEFINKINSLYNQNLSYKNGVFFLKSDEATTILTLPIGKYTFKEHRTKIGKNKYINAVENSGSGDRGDLAFVRTPDGAVEDLTKNSINNSFTSDSYIIFKTGRRKYVAFERQTFNISNVEGKSKQQVTYSKNDEDYFNFPANIQYEDYTQYKVNMDKSLKLPKVTLPSGKVAYLNTTTGKGYIYDPTAKVSPELIKKHAKNSERLEQYHEVLKSHVNMVEGTSSEDKTKVEYFQSMEALHLKQDIYSFADKYFVTLGPKRKLEAQMFDKQNTSAEVNGKKYEIFFDKEGIPYLEMSDGLYQKMDEKGYFEVGDYVLREEPKGSRKFVTYRKITKQAKVLGTKEIAPMVLFQKNGHYYNHQFKRAKRVVLDSINDKNIEAALITDYQGKKVIWREGREPIIVQPGKEISKEIMDNFTLKEQRTINKLQGIFEDNIEDSDEDSRDQVRNWLNYATFLETIADANKEDMIVLPAPDKPLHLIGLRTTKTLDIAIAETNKFADCILDLESTLEKKKIATKGLEVKELTDILTSNRSIKRTGKSKETLQEELAVLEEPFVRLQESSLVKYTKKKAIRNFNFTEAPKSNSAIQRNYYQMYETSATIIDVVAQGVHREVLKTKDEAGVPMSVNKITGNVTVTETLRQLVGSASYIVEIKEVTNLK